MVLCMVVLGGMGHIAGVVLGALLLTVLPEALRHTASPIQQKLFGKVILDPANLRMLLFGLALVLMMLLRPAGLWPSPTRRRELTSDARSGQPSERAGACHCSKRATSARRFGGLQALTRCRSASSAAKSTA